jgi:hypothetical protein
MTREEHIREIWEYVENPKHESIWCLHSRGTNTENLKTTKVNMRRGSGTSVKIS